MDSSHRLKMFKQMLRIRRLQERIDAEYLQDNMRTPVHLCIGQEAIAVGVCAALQKDDVISSNHRGHGHYLAKGGDMSRLVAELHCRTTGCSHGYGGSMHIIDTSVGHLGSSSIVAGGIPIGAGYGLAFHMRKEPRVSVVFFGDGASEEGVFYESIHFAVLKKLPVVFILENNKWAVCSPLKQRKNARSVFHTGYDSAALTSWELDGNDVELVHNAARDAVQRARDGEGPSFIECHTYRISGHAGCKAQDPKGYRDALEIEAWQKLCPLSRYRTQLQESGILGAESLCQIEAEISNEIDGAFEFALSSPLPDPKDVMGTVYCE